MVDICCDGVGTVRQRCVFWGVNQCRDFHVGGVSCVEDMTKNVFWMFSGEFCGKQGQRGFAGKLLGVVYCSFFSYSSV